MKIGIVGFAGVGKTTVFEWLTGAKPDHAAVHRGQIAIAKITDPRLDWLSNHFKPKKTTPATIEFMDTPGLMPTERKDNARRLSILREAGGLLIVVAGFQDDPARQLQDFRYELVFADLEIITNRIGRLEDQLKKPRPAKEKDADQQELDLLGKIKDTLEAGQPVAELGLNPMQEKTIRSFQLLTLKPEVVLFNHDENGVGKEVPGSLNESATNLVAAPAKLELELAELDDDDRELFMADMGLEHFTKDETLRKIPQLMGRIVFFTVGEDECRAWSLNKGADAPTGAAQIHTDLAEGFIRAEVVPFEDFQRVGSMKEAKAQGVYRLEGKTYIVLDGDIMHILANK